MDRPSREMYEALVHEYARARYKGLTTDKEHREALYELRLEFAEYGVLRTRGGRIITPQEVKEKHIK